jgi:hypothetical protein
MLVHTFCIGCHHRLEDSAKDHILSARIFVCSGCTRRRRFQHLLCRREGLIGLSAAMALMNPSYDFRQYEFIATDEWDEWPQLNEDIDSMLRDPVASILRQNVLSRIYRRFRNKGPHEGRSSIRNGLRPSLEKCIMNDLIETHRTPRNG